MLVAMLVTPVLVAMLVTPVLVAMLVTPCVCHRLWLGLPPESPLYSLEHLSQSLQFL